MEVPTHVEGTIEFKSGAIATIITSFDIWNGRGLGVADMSNCIETGEKPRAGVELTNHVLEIMHAFHRSSDTKGYVDLETRCEAPRPPPLGLIKGYVK